MLTKMNFLVWAIKMQVNFPEQGVWDVVEIARVEVPKDRMALTAVYQAILEGILLMLSKNDTTKDAWEILKRMHMRASRLKEANIQTLRSDFKVIRMKDGKSGDDFFMGLNTIVSGIRSLGEKIEEIVVVKKFL